MRKLTVAAIVLLTGLTLMTVLPAAAEQVIPLLPGINFAGVTVNPDPPLFSRNLLNQHPEISAIYQYNQENQCFEFLIRMENSTFGPDFPLEAGQGYIIQASSPLNLTLQGSENLSNIIPLKTGFNLVSLPGATSTSDSDAATLLQTTGDIRALFHWNASEKGFEFLFRLDGQNFGRNFTIRPGDALFIKTIRDSEIRSAGSTTGADLAIQEIPAGALEILPDAEQVPGFGEIAGIIHLLDAITGAPTRAASTDDRSGIRVWLKDRPEISSLTDVDGRFKLKDVPATIAGETHTLEFEKQDNGNRLRGVLADVPCVEKKRIDLDAAERPPVIKYTGSIEGTVGLEDGSIPEGSEVYIPGVSDLHELVHADGSFQLSYVPEGDFSLIIQSPGCEPLEIPVQVKGNQVTRLEKLTLRNREHQEELADIEGILLDDNGDPIAGAAIHLTDRKGQTRFGTITDSEGRYVFHGLKLGWYKLAFVKPDYRGHLQEFEVKQTGKNHCNGKLEKIPTRSEEPVVETPVAEEPAQEEPVVETPVAEEPAQEEPVVETPVAEEPVVETPVAEEPVQEEPTAEEPAVEPPVTEVPAPAQLIGWWKLDDDPNGTAFDSSVSANPGQVTGAAPADGADGLSLDFSGNSRVAIPDHPAYQLEQLSVTAWARPDQASSFVLYKYSLSTGFFLREVNGLWLFHLNGRVLYSTSPIVTGEWTHIAATYDGRFFRLYINGVEEAVQEIVGLKCDNQQPLVFGSSGASWFDGRIDDVRIYDGPLTPDEIRSLVDEAVPGQIPVIEEPPAEEPLPPAGPDLVITDIRYVGHYIKVFYRNDGDMPESGDFLIRLSCGDKSFPGNSYYRFPVPEAGVEKVTGGFTVGLLGLVEGMTGDITAEIDWEGRVPERNEENNILTRHLEIGPFQLNLDRSEGRIPVNGTFDMSSVRTIVTYFDGSTVNFSCTWTATRGGLEKINGRWQYTAPSTPGPDELIASLTLNGGTREAVYRMDVYDPTPLGLKTMEEFNANKWLGGDIRPGFGPRNVGTGQSITPVTDLNGFTLDLPILQWTPGPVTGTPELIIALRNTSGQIIEQQCVLIPEMAPPAGSVPSCRVTCRFQTKLTAGEEVILTWWLPDGFSSCETFTSPGNTADTYPAGGGFMGETKDNGDLADWSYWSAHPWDFDLTILP